MHTVIDLTTDEVQQRIKKDNASDVISYDKLHYEFLKLSGILSEGIIKQFPDKFIK